MIESTPENNENKQAVVAGDTQNKIPPSAPERAQAHTDTVVDVKDTTDTIAVALMQPSGDSLVTPTRPSDNVDRLLPPSEVGLKVESVQAVTKTLHKRQDALLEALSKFFPHVQRACMLAGCTRTEFKKWFESSTEFRERVQEIINDAMDTLEMHGMQMALSPINGFSFWNAMLKAYRPEKFAPRLSIPSDIRSEFDSEADRARRIRLAEIVATDAEVIEATTGAPPPHIETRRKDEISPVETVDQITPPGPSKGTVIAQPVHPEYEGDMSLVVESMEGEARKFDPTFVPEISRPKKPTRPDFSPDPHPLPPSHKNSRKKQSITVDKTKN